ncbi:hypothetical protein SAM40697_2978 [Streptomyces ambofaciens]|uniref:Uncharacterized protein n=1 Tax=Streptomyces ambofaciens TaxID=1889 RepID=A0ABM6AZR7_STRAM|nr:hypothetical protein SAM40697_2978 [Streptomyces ambofaciens]
MPTPGAGHAASPSLALAAMMFAVAMTFIDQTIVRDVTEAITGNADTRAPTGDGALATTVREAMPGIRRDFAEADQWVFYGMAVALALGYCCALRHSGGRAATPSTRAADEAADAAADEDRG